MKAMSEEMSHKKADDSKSLPITDNFQSKWIKVLKQNINGMNGHKIRI